MTQVLTGDEIFGPRPDFSPRPSLWTTISDAVYLQFGVYLWDILLAVIWNITTRAFHTVLLPPSYCCRPYLGFVHRRSAQYLPPFNPTLQEGFQHRPSPLLVCTFQKQTTNPCHGTPERAQLQSPLRGTDTWVRMPAHTDKCGSSQKPPLRFYFNSRHKLKLQATPFTGPETSLTGP